MSTLDNTQHKTQQQQQWQENVIPAKRSTLPANTGSGRFNVLDTGNGSNWQQSNIFKLLQAAPIRSRLLLAA
ncbi:GH22693 [Drosophila grimshawi]|uniref:GH22693 n=1 Tax=Drosophila grimshawi TaxID=7222 RepID=B4JVD4_DROGR|nr:GH22693 [Drosophila grimshawi]